MQRLPIGRLVEGATDFVARRYVTKSLSILVGEEINRAPPVNLCRLGVSRMAALG